MKKVYVAYFPQFKKDSWILKFHSQNDEKNQFVAPHMTLVFPTEILSTNDLFEEVKRITSDISKFKVHLKSALLMPEHNNNKLSSIFLVPDEGFGDFVQLHDRLYSGKLKPALRLDIPYIPHLTIGSNLSLADAKTKVDILNSENIDLELWVDRLTIVEIIDPKMDRKLIHQCELK